MDKEAAINGVLYDRIKKIINEVVGEEGVEYTLGKFTGDGWLNFHYVCSTYDGQYPRVSLKQQKAGVHVYIMLWIEGKPILENYIDVFGKTAVGKGCLRLKKLTDEGEVALREIIQCAVEKNKE